MVPVAAHICDIARAANDFTAQGSGDCRRFRQSTLGVKVAVSASCIRYPRPATDRCTSLMHGARQCCHCVSKPGLPTYAPVSRNDKPCLCPRSPTLSLSLSLRLALLTILKIQTHSKRSCTKTRSADLSKPHTTPGLRHCPRLRLRSPAIVPPRHGTHPPLSLPSRPFPMNTMLYSRLPCAQASKDSAPRLLLLLRSSSRCINHSATRRRCGRLAQQRPVQAPQLTSSASGGQWQKVVWCGGGRIRHNHSGKARQGRTSVVAADSQTKVKAAQWLHHWCWPEKKAHGLPMQSPACKPQAHDRLLTGKASQVSLCAASHKEVHTPGLPSTSALICQCLS